VSQQPDGDHHQRQQPHVLHFPAGHSRSGLPGTNIKHAACFKYIISVLLATRNSFDGKLQNAATSAMVVLTMTENPSKIIT
jgi:hypothetical protein